MTRPEPWSGRKDWHVARWGPLGWAETTVKAAALILAVVVGAQQLLAADGLGWAVPRHHQLPFWLVVAVAVGYLITAVDRWIDREIISMIFVVASLLGHWSLVIALGGATWPGSATRVFALLMIVGELIKIVYFTTSGARVRTLPRRLPIMMTAALAAVHLVVAVTA